jgi:hypothetical protein
VIFDAASKFHNYSVAYQPAFVDMFYLMRKQRWAKIINVNRTFKIPQVFFEIRQLEARGDYLKASDAVRTSKVYVFVTPSEEYSTYVKFLMAFSPGTWILLSTIISIYTLLIISSSLAHHFQKKENIWKSIVKSLLGIFQPQLPNKRIILIFILICFIFQICFQSNLFKLMQEDSKTSVARTIDDLIDSGYTVYSPSYSIDIINGGIEGNNRWYDRLLFFYVN